MLTAEELNQLNPDLTQEVMEKIDEVIARYKGKPGCLIPVLEECQHILGYIPVELQDYLSQELQIPGATIYGVVSFYSFFSMVRKGGERMHQIKVCIGTACYVKGGKLILDKISEEFDIEVGGVSQDGRFCLDGVRCLGACGLAPIVVVDKDTYGGVQLEKVREILEKYE